MGDHVIDAKTGHYNFSPYGFISYSQDFYQAFCNHITDRPFSPAKYYLGCKSIELSLKAFLLLNGKSRNYISNTISHNLEKSLEKCNEFRLQSLVSISANQEKEIVNLNSWYERKGFEFFEMKNLVSSPRDLPPIENVAEICKLLLAALEQPCKEEANRQ